jgi:metal-responsive CopG/Arc/MetJ family transcriptional regulator
MKNAQITVEEETLQRVDQVAKALGLTRTEIVRQALRQWLRQRSVERFEHQWIAALGRNPDVEARADDWLAAETWGSE